MSRNQATLKVLYERKERLKADMEALRARLDEVESLIRTMSGEAPSEVPTKPRRGDLKEIILSLYEEAAEGGLSTVECINAAQAKRGVNLLAASVSSALSRLKAMSVLMYDGDRYRLKKYAGPRSAAL